MLGSRWQGRSTLCKVRSEQRQFDLNQLTLWINQARTDRDLTWAQVSREVGDNDCLADAVEFDLKPAELPH